jgi:membrane protein implicated in regulation of membrane protease activity
MWNIWWVWVVAGFGLGVLEVLLPGYIFLGFAVGAVVTGVLLGVGLSVGLAALMLIFGLVSLAAWFVMRQLFGLREGQVKIWHKDIND